MYTRETTPFAKLLRKTLLTFLLVGIVGLSAYGIYSWRREEQGTRENLRILSGFLATASQSFFDDLGNGLAPLGELLDNLDVKNHPEAARAHLLNFEKRHPQVRSVAVFMPDGKMLINTAVRAGSPLPDFRQDPPYFRRLMQDMNSSDLYVLGAPEVGKALNVWRFSVRHVVRDKQGKAKFMVQAAVPLEKGGTFLYQLPLPPNSFIGLLRSDGFQQARYPVGEEALVFGHMSTGPASEMIRANPGILTGYFKGKSPWVINDQPRVGAFSKLPRQDMYAYISVPEAFLWGQWWQNNAPVLFSFIVFFVLFVIISLRVTKRETFHSRELIEQAHRDALTGLPNRSSLNDILNADISSASASDKKFAVLFLDLDRFKGINDTFGHTIGDKLLIKVSQIIQELLREGDVLGRFGGDEFLLILYGTDESGVALIAQRIQESFNTPFDIDGHSLRITPSIGIAVFPEHGRDIETILKHADTAMYESKRLGRNASTVYGEQMGRRVRDRMEKEHLLREALQQEMFQLVYQPIVDMQSSEIVSVEALVRWVMPDGSWRMPGEFIYVAEDSGMIIQLGEWVLRTACRQLNAWRGMGFNLTVAVNLSPRQFQDPHLLEKVTAIIHECGVDTCKLKLEVTESMAMQNPEESVKTLRSLTDLGVGISIDDFGTGYSSLSYLKRLPADTIKIDKSFIEGIDRELQDATIVRTVIALANALGKHSVAEGIETLEQYESIKAMGCEFAQGYLINIPLKADALTAILQGGKKFDVEACRSQTAI